MINDLKSIGNSKKINNAKGKKQEKVSRFDTTQRSLVSRNQRESDGWLSSNIGELRITASKNSLPVPRRRSSHPGA